MKTDITNPEDVNALAVQAKQTFGFVDIYVNNAGIMDSSRVKDGDVSNWARMIDINVKGVLYGIHSVLPDMLANQSGHIVNIASDSGYEVTERLTVYCDQTCSPCYFCRIGEGARKNRCTCYQYFSRND